MWIVSVFKKGNHQAICLPPEMDFGDVDEFEIAREGNSLILRPKKPDWESFPLEGKADANFLIDRKDVSK